jgi:hypothetical protein
VKIGQLSEELSEEIRAGDVPVTFPAISSTCLPEAINGAITAMELSPRFPLLVNYCASINEFGELGKHLHQHTAV